MRTNRDVRGPQLAYPIYFDIFNKLEKTVPVVFNVKLEICNF